MKRLLKIELKKWIHYRAFWLMVAFYLLLLVLMIFGIPGLIDYIAEKSGETAKLRIFKAIVFNFPDIWQNISFVAGTRYFIKIIPGIIVIFLVTSEFHLNTIRQHMIFGMKRGEFLTAKILVVLLLSALSTLILFFSGLYLGLSHSAGREFQMVFSRMEFLAGYFLEFSVYLLFCMMLSVLLRKTAITFIAHFIYLIAEPVIEYWLNDRLDPFLPLNAMNRIIQSPNTSLIKVSGPGFNFHFQEQIGLQDTLICLVWGLIFIGVSYLLLKRRDM